MMQERESRSTYSAALGAFCLGALGGAIVGLLYAPTTGRETRERMNGRLRRTAESASRKTREVADALSSRLKRAGASRDEFSNLEG